MVFPHKGENHENGVRNEKEIVEFQNKNIDNELNVCLMDRNKTSKKCLWLHKGGTQLKQDAEVEVELENGEKTIEQISIKNHKSGTFDWINSTKLVPENINENVNEFKNKHYGKDVTKELRGELEEIFSAGLDTITSEMITGGVSNSYLSLWEKFEIHKKYIGTIHAMKQFTISFIKLTLRKIIKKY